MKGGDGRGDGGGDMDDQAQGSVRRAAEVLDCHLIMYIILINKHPHNM